MVKLQLIASPTVQEELPHFQELIEEFGLRITIEEILSQQCITLTIDTNTAVDGFLIEEVAYDCFMGYVGCVDNVGH